MAFNPFGSVPVPKKGRTNFNESHTLSGTFPLSKVCPVFFTETIPGDSWNINVFNLTKLQTLIAPAMQQVDASLLWFKLPKRLLFKHFKKWYSGGEDGQDEHQKPHIHLFKLTQYLNFLDDDDIQQFTEDFFGPGSLWNYLGLPCPLYYSGLQWEVLPLNEWAQYSSKTGDNDFIDITPLMAYHYIYDCYFRDQTLSDAMFEDAEEGNFIVNKGFLWENSSKLYYFGPEAKEDPSADVFVDTTGADLSEGGEIDVRDVLPLLYLFNRAWRKDYFTSALPTPQRGPEVKLGITEDSAPVTSSVSGSILIDEPTLLKDDFTQSGDVTASLGRLQVNGETSDSLLGVLQNKSITGTADLSGLSPISIVAFRNLFKLQQFLEKNNISGGRYIETILAHWGERVPDFTVQRPQFVRATSLPIQVSEVTATANSSGVNSLIGDQAGRMKTQGNLGKVHIYTQEPSFIFGLYCVTAPGSYAGQGIPKLFQRITRFDEPWTDFQHIGEQAIKTKELYLNFEDSQHLDIDFGYQQRFSEYKYMPNRIVGDFQTSLAFWHMARMFDEVPQLNDDFVTQHLDPRIFAVQYARPVIADFYFEATAKRKLSKFSTPKLT